MLLLKYIYRSLFLFIPVYFILLFLLVFSGCRNAVRKVDIIVVFGTKVNLDGTPSAGLKARLDETLLLYQQHNAPLVFVSGGMGKEGYNEALVMRQYLLRHGIPDTALIVDDKGNNTRATVVNLLDYMDQHHLRSVMAVSQYYHLPRISLAFQQAGKTLTGQAAPFYASWRDFFSVNRELVAYPVYWLKWK